MSVFETGLIFEKGVERIKGVISYNLNRNILFDKIEHGENFLILYSNTNSHKQIFHNFFRHLANKNSISVYISHKSNQLNLNSDVQNCSLNIINKDVILDLKNNLDKCFKEMEKGNINMTVVADWSNLNISNCELFLPFMEELIKRSKSLNPPIWKRKYGESVSKTPLTLINALETTNLNEELIQQLIQMHSRVYLLEENLNTFLLPMISPPNEIIFPKFHVLPQEILEKHVKDNLELIALILLEKNDKSGYQILKEIAGFFHCVLSQGTLYPLLYQLEKENKIIKKNGKGREVLYSLSDETKKELNLRTDTCLKAYQHLAGFFKR